MSIQYLVWGNVAVWVGVCAYLLYIGRRQSAAEKRLRQLSALQDGRINEDR